MKLRNKILSLLLIMTLLGITAFTGCGTKEDSKTSETVNNENTVSKEDSSNEKTDAQSDSDGKIGDGSESFTFWVPIHPFTAKAMNTLNEHPGAKLLKEATGVDVEFINPPVGQAKDNINLLIGAMDLPEVFKFNRFEQIYSGGLEAAIEDGVILDATKIIEENAPNFMAMLNEDEALRKDAYTDSGILKGFGGTVVYESGRGRPMRGPIINKDYLDEAGLDVPQTIDDWEEMLRKFKEMGVKLPYSNQIQRGDSYSIFASAFGVPGNSMFFREGNTVKYGPLEPGFKDYLMLMNKWYEEGLIDPDFATKEVEKDLNPAILNGELASCVNYVTVLANLPNNAKNQNKELNLIAAPYPVLKEGDKVHIREFTSNFDPSGFAYITTEAKNPELIVKWIDFLYSPEGRQITTFGEEGNTFITQDNGDRIFTDVIDSNEAKRQKILRDIALTWEVDDHKLFYKSPLQHEAWEVWSEADIEGTLPTSLQLTVEESEVFVGIKSQLDTYVQEMQLKYIMGLESFDTYDKFIQTLKDMKVEEAIEIQQAAYDRYLER